MYSLYSIHTIELSCAISFDEYHMLIDKLHLFKPAIEKRKPHISQDKKFLICEVIYRKIHMAGINCIKLKEIRTKKENILLSCYLYITVNMANILSDKEYVTTDIINPNSIDIAFYTLKDILNTMIGEKIAERILSNTLNRVDFCCDLKMPTQEMAEEYLRLLRRGIPPKALTEKKILDNSQHRYLPYKDSFLLQCKSYEFQVYLKYNQMKNISNSQNIDSARGLLRFELRAKKAKIKRFTEKYTGRYATTDNLEFLNTAPLIAETEIPRIISKMVGTGTFHSYQITKKMILDEHFRPKTESLMLDILDYYSNHPKYQNLLEDLELPRDKWNRLLKNFNKINASPIPVPRTYKKQEYPGIYSWDTLIAYQIFIKKGCLS